MATWLEPPPPEGFQPPAQSASLTPPVAAPTAAHAARSLRARITDKTGSDLVYLVVGEARLLLAERDDWGSALAERDAEIERLRAGVEFAAREVLRQTHVVASDGQREALEAVARDLRGLTPTEKDNTDGR